MFRGRAARLRSMDREAAAGAARLPFGYPLDDLNGGATLTQGAGQRETGNTGTDDQRHACAVTSALPSRLGLEDGCSGSSGTGSPGRTPP